ncbi:beta-galactosidase [Brachybacterium sp. AOP43-C2-M15]|uniref:beta-galactosidase n=1 Tax=Brachybacterium sp. AOP43-C2-M15 TaxID=3457661 RepID=UPI004034F2FF
MTRDRSLPEPPSASPSAPSPAVPGSNGIAYGGDYNPEQWPPEVWREDVRLMRKAGVNLVSVGIWSWSKLEPRPGEFETDWLDELLDLLHSSGIRVDLATPTAAPPAWFFRAHPEARVVGRDLVPQGPGSRGMACPSSPAYREACARITTVLGERYGSHPAVAMWHVHNEYGAPVGESFSESAHEHFRLWVKDRYGALDSVNRAWGTAFWGQTLGTWADVLPPLPTPTVANPSRELDWRRFSNQAILECFQAERDILHSLSPGIPVTTNFMAHTCPNMDLWRWAREVDVVSNDHYLVAEDPRNFVELALDADLTRSLSGGRPWILMEHSTSGVNWQGRNVAKRPGEMARNSLSHLARGADGIMFFQWRASRKGAEKFHSAMLPHAGTGSRVFREVRELGAELAGLAEVQGSTASAEVAILFDWESHWAQDLPWRPAADLGHREQIRSWYERLWRDHLAVDFMHPEADLSAYRLVLAPASYLLTDAAAGNLEQYVDDGGNLVVGPFSGIVDECDGVREGGLNAALAGVLGVEVQEFCPLRVGEPSLLELPGGAFHEAQVWTEDLQPTTAEILSRYVDGPVGGSPAITRADHGAGQAWYVSADLSIDALSSVFTQAYAAAGIVVPNLPEDVELLTRTSPDGDRFLFAINHTAQDHELALPDGRHLTVPAGGTATATVPTTISAGAL